MVRFAKDELRSLKFCPVQTKGLQFIFKESFFGTLL